MGPRTGNGIVLLEAGVEEAIEPSLKKIGLPLLQDGRGQQFTGEAGRYDLLCEGGRGELVMVEIKRGNQTGDQVVGQCLRYMGFVKERLAAKGQRVKGLILTGGLDPSLAWALKGLPEKELIAARVFRLP